MMELYKNSSDLNFNFVESFDAKKNLSQKDENCVIIFSDSYETSSELDTTSHKQRNQANARERYRTHRYWFLMNSFEELKLNTESITSSDLRWSNLSKFSV